MRHLSRAGSYEVTPRPSRPPLMGAVVAARSRATGPGNGTREGQFHGRSEREQKRRPHPHCLTETLKPGFLPGRRELASHATTEEIPDDLLGAVPLPLHLLRSSFAHCRGREGLSNRADRIQGVGPAAVTLVEIEVILDLVFNVGVRITETNLDGNLVARDTVRTQRGGYEVLHSATRPEFLKGIYSWRRPVRMPSG